MCSGFLLVLADFWTRRAVSLAYRVSCFLLVSLSRFAAMRQKMLSLESSLDCNDRGAPGWDLESLTYPDHHQIPSSSCQVRWVMMVSGGIGVSWAGGSLRR